ncbi:MAG: hypothetical protein GTO18_03000 [Anaerolineales bacterium]|nr:hypothetical protein [Anaerolineales bacterium]
MAIPVLVHISGEDPVRGEIEDLPTPADTNITINNPRKRDGKDLRYLLDNVVTVVFPMHRINFIEILPSAEEEKIIGFVRE